MSQQNNIKTTNKTTLVEDDKATKKLEDKYLLDEDSELSHCYHHMNLEEPYCYMREQTTE